MKKKFLVLGSNSFSGSNFINLLLKKNCKVVGVSRSEKCSNVYLPYRNSPNLKLFRFYKLDINYNLKKFLSLVKKFKPNFNDSDNKCSTNKKKYPGPLPEIAVTLSISPSFFNHNIFPTFLNKCWCPSCRIVPEA